MMDWTKEKDSELLRAIRLCKSIAEAARSLGISRNSAIARYHRIQGTVFPYAAQAKAEAAKAAEAKRKKREKAECEVLERLALLIKQGVPRRVAIKRAYRDGARLRIIGEQFGITKQAVHQIVNDQ